MVIGSLDSGRCKLSGMVCTVGRVGSGWVWEVCVGDGCVVSESMDSGCHELSENVWFVWSNTPYSGFKWRYYQCVTTKREDRAFDL